MSACTQGVGEWLVVISSCEYVTHLSGWRRFKDYVRQNVKEQPGWVDVCIQMYSGEMQGCVRLRNRGEAHAVFSECLTMPRATTNSLSELHRKWKHILVHVWQISRRSNKFHLRNCNCSYYFQKDAHFAARCGIDIGEARDLSSVAHLGFLNTTTVKLPNTGQLCAHLRDADLLYA